MLFWAWAQNRGNTLLLNKLVEFENFGGAICLNLAGQLKNADIKMIDTSYKFDFLYQSHAVLLMELLVFKKDRQNWELRKKNGCL